MISFNYDRGSIGCAFNQITDKQINPGYQVWSVYRYLYDIAQSANQNGNADWGSPKTQLEQCSNIIQTKLKYILNGNFSWLNDYLKKQKREAQLSLFVLDLNRDHPFHKKFWAGDLSWMTDAEKYVRDNNITLPDSPWS